LAKEIQALKTELASEQENRLSLEQSLFALQANKQSGQDRVTKIAAVPTESEESGSVEQQSEDQARELQQVRTARNRLDFRKQNLLQNGFAEEEANWILQSEAQVQLDSLNEQYRARRAQTEVELANGTRAKSRTEQLREKLGDDYYERYLEANGFPTAVGVRSVLDGSPGSNAGLQAGDRIVSYDGNRVFNIRELNGLTVLGDEGKSVLIEVERDGNPVQITLPRGPIGITGGRGRF